MWAVTVCYFSFEGGGNPLVGNVLHKDKTLFQVVQERILEVRNKKLEVANSYFEVLGGEATRKKTN